MSLFAEEVHVRAERIVARAHERHETIATAESCTGGLIAALITSIAGSSAVFTHGFVTYANEAKTSMIGVSPDLIATYGAVSEPVARAMAEGARNAAHSSIAVSATGIAGPGGATAEKPVGLVYLACAHAGDETHYVKHIFSGDRDSVRMQAVLAALALIEQALG